MGKKIMNTVLFLVVLGGCVAMTLLTGNGSSGTMIYNFAFLAVMAVIYLAGLFGGMFRVDSIGEALARGTQELSSIFKIPGKAKSEDLSCLKGMFEHKYLDDRMDSFVDAMEKNQEGIGDVEDYINEDEIDLHVHKKILEMAPDIFTSLGILGTFIGLVWGLKSFEPSSYETMTTSVSALVDGIKVAFLTSIYGIAFALIYSSGMKSVYSGMDAKLQGFLERFHLYVLPAAESESRNLMLASQKVQTKAMKQMAEQLTSQMAESFEKAINPTFQKMTESLETLTESVTKCQEDVVQDILRTFLREMNGSFKMQFTDFNEALVQLKEAQKENIDYICVHGSLNKKEQVENMNLVKDKSLIIATTSYFGEGIDFPHLNTIMFATPISYYGRLVQYLGRIGRGNQECLAIDFLDSKNAMLNSAYKKRLEGYKQMHYK